MLFKTRNNVPDPYTEESRDFQLFEAILDCIFNYNVSNQFKENYIDDLELASSEILNLEADYLGFFTKQYCPESLLRNILLLFPKIINYKGSEEGIRLALLALENAFNDVSYITLNKIDDKDSTWNIQTDGTPINRKYLEELLKYVLPAGALIENIYFEYSSGNVSDNILGKATSVLLQPVGETTDNDNIELILGSIRTKYNEYSNNDVKNRLLSSVSSTPVVIKESKFKEVLIKGD